MAPDANPVEVPQTLAAGPITSAAMWPATSSTALKHEAKLAKFQEKLAKARTKSEILTSKLEHARSKNESRLEKAQYKRQKQQIKRDRMRVREEIAINKALDKKARDEEREALAAQGLRRTWLFGRVVPVKQSRRARRHLRKVGSRNPPPGAM